MIPRLEGVNRNHPLLDGNKRLSWVASVVLANLNGHDLTCTADEGDQVIRQVAAGAMAWDEIVRWVDDHVRPLERRGGDDQAGGLPVTCSHCAAALA